jgi:hypothetical protein
MTREEEETHIRIDAQSDSRRLEDIVDLRLLLRSLPRQLHLLLTQHFLFPFVESEESVQSRIVILQQSHLSDGEGEEGRKGTHTIGESG